MASLATADCILDAQRAAVLLDPLRLRLVAELREPNSASSLAQQLKMPRQSI